MELYAVIMAGGVGSRFWPRSRQKMPKQLLSIFSNDTLIKETFKRLDELVKTENIYIITNKIQKQSIENELPELPKDNIIAEPFGKNTAACIGLASAVINNKSKDAIVITLPADHLIKDVDKFISQLKIAAEYAQLSKSLVTIGIKPTHPETGYGYIQIAEKLEDQEIHKVKTFAEKPNYETAKRFLEDGDFFWNSGIFIWSVSSILAEIKKYMPELNEGLTEIEKAIDTEEFDSILSNEYAKLKKISIDYGVMEKSKCVYLVKGDFGWSDVGSWETVYQISEKDKNKNSGLGETYNIDSFNSYIYSEKKFVATIGVQNLIIIETDDALLVCDRNSAQKVTQVVDYLKMNNKADLI